VLATLRWLVPSLVPSLVVALAIWRTDRRREPWRALAVTFAFGIVFALPTYWIQAKAAAWTGLDARASVAGDAGSLVFLFALVSPMREASKVAAAWPAFRSSHFDEPFDGVVYASVAAMGFATADSVRHLIQHPHGAIWIARVLFAVPAHLFFACLWGYALGRAKHTKRPGALFPSTWLAATLGHAFYSYLVYYRPPGALYAALGILLAMGLVAFFMARDLHVRSDRQSRESDPLFGGRLSSPSLVPSSGARLSSVPSLRAVRAALRRADQPIRIRWIALGTLVTLGAMIAGLAASIAFGRYAHVDFALVDEHDVSTTAPVALLGAGLLAAFPLSGFLVARASGLPTLLEPAVASALAILAALALLGFAAPIAMVFALAFSPFAFALACAGAWVGRVVR